MRRVRFCLVLAVQAALVLAGLAVARPARAQAVQSLAATDYLIEYTTHAHAYVEDAPILPRFSDGSVWSEIHTALMHNRQGSGLYLLGDENLHLFPTRVGVLGWGLYMGLRF
jgi:hypothetical protein